MPFQNTQPTTTETATNTPSDTVLAMLKGAIQSLDPNTLIELLSEDQLDALGGSTKTPDEQLNELGIGCVMDWVKDQDDTDGILSDHFSDVDHEVIEWIRGTDHWVVFNASDTSEMTEWLDRVHGIACSDSEYDWKDWLENEGYTVVSELSEIDLDDLDEDDLKEHLEEQGWLVYGNTDDIELSIFGSDEIANYLRDCGSLVYHSKEDIQLSDLDLHNCGDDTDTILVDVLLSKGWIIYNTQEALEEDLTEEVIYRQAEGLLTASALVRMLADRVNELETKIDYGC